MNLNTTGKNQHYMNKFITFNSDIITITPEYVVNFLQNAINKAKVTDIDFDSLYDATIRGLPKSITPNDFYNYVADKCVVRTSQETNYNKLAATILVDRLHKITNDDYVTSIELLYNNKDVKDRHCPLVSQELYNLVLKNKEQIQKAFDYERDYNLDYFAIRTLERSYLIKLKGKTGDVLVERPQHMFMRVALGIHNKNLKAAFETYDLMSNRYFTHATPTLFNAGTRRPQLSSCFLISCDDSLEEIFNCISQIASISKWAGGIGVHVAGVRPKNAVIRGTNGRSEGIIPLCSLLNKESKYVNQGGKRNGSIAVYNEPWHGDIFEFCELRKNTGSEDLRARDLFFALWIPDLFMKRIEEDGIWSLMCPDECRGLNTSHGEEFEKLYTQYEQERKFLKQVPARKLWKHILECQIETGFPYMCYKDNANRKSNQQNLGTIRSSNLCVSGSTKILTDNGEIEIGKNVNTQVNVWNGEEWSPVILKHTGSNVSLTKISFSNGATLLCTLEHKFLVNGNSNKIETKNLKIGDNINDFKLPNNSIVKNISITNLEVDFSIEDTFCFTEHKRGLGIFNGLLTGQCAEIIEYSDSNEIAVCNLASLCLPRFITVSEDGTKTFNHEELIKVCRVAVRNLNKVIDRNFYPTKETQHSNFKHRPVAIGVQGLSDVYNIMQMSWDSDESRLLNKQIFETIYYGCLDESKELAKKFGQYVSFTGSPFSKGELQYDLWGLTEKDLTMGYDWLKLKEEIKQYGTRNSLLTALMPTASTAQIMGCCECMEPYMSNIFVRTTLAGEFIVINENLQRDLKKLGLWSQDMYKKLVIYRGSIQSIPEIPDKIKEIYKTGFELPLRSILQQSVERGPFIDQSQSLNLFMAEPDFTFLTSAHFYGWKNGLKTGMYYLRGTPAVDPVNFGIDVNDIKRLTNNLDPVKAIKDNYATTKLRNRLFERKENSETNSDEPVNNDNDPVDDNNDNEETVMCKYDPNKNAEGCLMCQ
jgi:ribonucleotide reductase alpha subunit